MTISMKRSVTALLAFALLASTSMAACAGILRGAQSCDNWMQYKQNEAYQLANEVWLLGFLSGLSQGLDNDFIKGTDNKTIFRWVDNYCIAYPHKNIGEAGEALAAELIKQKSR